MNSWSAIRKMLANRASEDSSGAELDHMADQLGSIQQDQGAVTSADLIRLGLEPGDLPQEQKPAPTPSGGRRFNGKWVQTPQGLKFIETDVWYE